MTASVDVLQQHPLLRAPACDSTAAVWSLWTHVNGKEKKHSTRREGLRHTLHPVAVTAASDISTDTHVFLILVALFLHLKALLKDSPRNGDSCGVCPNWQRPQPRAGNGAGPRAGLRRRASVQQPLLHRRRRLRDGVVSCSRSVSGWHFLILARRKRRLTRIFSVSNCHVSSG